jgi:hypothetical protein
MDPEFLTAPEQRPTGPQFPQSMAPRAVLLGILPGANPTELKQTPTKLMP